MNSDEARGQQLHGVFRIVNEETRNTVESPVTKAIRLDRSSSWRIIPS